MTTPSGKTLQALIQDFFIKHLTVERHASTHTVAAYRDAIKLFLQYAAELRKCAPEKLDHTVLDTATVCSFLDWLQRNRNSSARTRNQRLAAIKSFVRYVASLAPEHLERCRRIRDLPPARFEHPEIQYLTEDEVIQLMASIDPSKKKGRRDRALLLLLYNTGARVQEIVRLNASDICSQPIAFVTLQGKGRKTRTCPLWSRTVSAIQHMLVEQHAPDSSQPLFLNAGGRRLSRSGVAHLLRSAQHECGLHPSHAKSLAPHVMRHTTAMHLLQSGVDITTIAAWLGHAQLTTTHGYVEIDMRMKQTALANETALPDIRDIPYPSPDIVDWLDALARRPRYVQRSPTMDT